MHRSFRPSDPGTVKCGGRPFRRSRRHDGRLHLCAKRRAGAFALDADDEALFISVVTPAGYIAPLKEGVPAVFPPLHPPSAKRFDSRTAGVPGTAACYELLAIADPQPKTDEHFERLRTEIIPPLQAATAAKKRRSQSGRDSAGRHRMGLAAVVRQSQGAVRIARNPVYGVIGNHDHDLNKFTDREATTENYRSHFAPPTTPSTWDGTHYIVLDDIVYHGARKYDEQIDSMQAWAAMMPNVCRRVRASASRCTPSMKSRDERRVMESAETPDGRLCWPCEIHISYRDIRTSTQFRHPRRRDGTQRGADMYGNLWRDLDQPRRHAQRLAAFSANAARGFRVTYQSGDARSPAGA